MTSRGGGDGGSLLRGLRYCCLASALGPFFISAPAAALDGSGGVGLGGTLAGAKPRLAVSPHASLSWRKDSGFLLSAHEAFSILPAVDQHGVGFNNQVSATVGYASVSTSFNIGPAFSIFSIPACGIKSCARVVGLSPGVQAEVSVYFKGALGVSASASLDWNVGAASALLGGVTATVLAGPVLRWRTK